jgi:hypothetical protein
MSNTLPFSLEIFTIGMPHANSLSHPTFASLYNLTCDEYFNELILIAFNITSFYS